MWSIYNHHMHLKVTCESSYNQHIRLKVTYEGSKEKVLDRVVSDQCGLVFERSEVDSGPKPFRFLDARQ